MAWPSLTAALAVLLMTLGARAADLPPGLHFSHDDWEVACDNTRTCRAAGYQADADELSVSVLLTRRAGPREAVTGELMIGEYGEVEALKRLPAEFRLTMRVNGRSLGSVPVRRDSLTANLTSAQVGALLAALPHRAEIEWRFGETRWRLSDKGAAAVLLKMDEFQGRVDTRGALVRPGPLDERAVATRLDVPQVIAAPVSKAPLSVAQKELGGSKPLRDALRATVSADGDGNHCPDLVEATDTPAVLSIARLTESKLLVSTRCWRGAYNTGEGYWVIDDALPYRPVLVTTSASDQAEGSISSAQKGRGLGDCWSSDTWTWDGRRFVHTESSSTGQCKLLAAGGGWTLPTIVTTVSLGGR